MKICVSAVSEGLDAQIDPRFGRAPYFVLVEAKGNEIGAVESIPNPAAGAVGGAGIQASQLIVSKGVEALITGNVGPNAFGVLNQSKVKVVTGVGGMSVKDAVTRFLNGELGQTQGPTAPGMQQGQGMGMGRGRGSGMGQGMGRGRGAPGGPGRW